MKYEGKNPIGAPALEMSARPKASEWLWRPWYAKLWWVLTLLYWIGLEGLMLVPAGVLNSDWVGIFLFLVLLFNPLTVLSFLGYGYLRAKVACGDWVITGERDSSVMGRLQRERAAAEINPSDARSGWMHREHINRGMRRRH